MATVFYCRMMSQLALVGLSTFVWAGPTLGDLQDTVPHVDVRDLVGKQVTRLEIEFHDGARAVAARDPGGFDISTYYTDAWGRSSSLFYRDDRRSASIATSDRAETSHPLGQIRPTMLWSGLQLRVLAGASTELQSSDMDLQTTDDADRAIGRYDIEHHSSPLESNGSLLMPRGGTPSRARHYVQEDMDSPRSLAAADAPDRIWNKLMAGAARMRFEFEDLAVSVEVERTSAAADGHGLVDQGNDIIRDPVAGDVLGSPEYTARLTHSDDGAIGAIRWYPNARVLSWDLPGVVQGWVDDSRMPGGIHFTPDMEWAALQNAVFWLDRSLYRAQTTDVMAGKRASDIKGTALASSIGTGAVSDTGTAMSSGNCPTQAPGCDRLGAFITFFFRPCCARHDYCYEYANNSGGDGPGGEPGCTAWSWVFFWSWQCARCNTQAVVCFLTGTLVNPGEQCTSY